jgi:hypothetical protein
MRWNWIDLKNENERENENWSENGNSDGNASGNGIKNAKMRLRMNGNERENESRIENHKEVKITKRTSLEPEKERRLYKMRVRMRVGLKIIRK